MARNVPQDLNRCFMRLRDRAERTQHNQIVETFVSVGPLLDVLASENNQAIYGRRGTGKTHALLYLANDLKSSGDITVYVDCQNIGSNQSIYEDKSLPTPERATRLVIDICAAIHTALLDEFSNPKGPWDLSKAAPLLDSLTEAMSTVKVVGSVEVEVGTKNEHSSTSKGKLSASIAATSSVGLSEENSDTSAATFDTKTKRIGVETSWITFGFFTQAMKSIANFAKKRIWVLIDEWSTVPIDIQPYLADLVKRMFFSIPTVTVKIAAIEHRSNFKMEHVSGYLGLELGADLAPALNLDDYLVFDNDEQRSVAFFKTLIGNHTRYLAKEMSIDLDLSDDEIVHSAFTQTKVFIELIRACEGVPRDAMHILTSAAQKANLKSIEMGFMRGAALSFFNTEKHSVIQASPICRELLEWIIDDVISGKKTRDFLLNVNISDENIDKLFDLRAIHIRSRSKSSAHNKGERYIVYKLDYGCYVDLINTSKAVSASIDIEDELFVIPEDDERSSRRAVLDLSKFYQQRAAKVGEVSDSDREVS